MKFNNKLHYTCVKQFTSSQRSTKFATEMPYYFCNRSPKGNYWTKDNRNGMIPFAVTENYLCKDLLIDKITNAQTNIEITAQTILYSAAKYYQPLQNTTSNFIHKHIAKQYKLNPDHFIITGGCGGLFPPLFHCISDPDDIILLPSPYFAGFKIDLTTMSSINLVSIFTDISNDYNINIETLNELYIKYGNRIKALVFTNPNNPLGKIYDKNQIEMVFKWCVEHKIHFIADELFALSKISNTKEFLSAIDCLHKINGFDKYFHFIYGLSKDLCLGGMRIGYYYTENEYIGNRMKLYHYNYNVPIHTQQLINGMFNDEVWCNMFVKENQYRIQKRFNVLVECLKQHNISYYKPDYGLFVWLNFNQYLKKINNEYKTELTDAILFELEKKLYFKFLNEQRLSLAPGQWFESTVAGYFRLCFTAEQNDNIIFDAVTRMSSVIQPL
eukprot:349312_1